MGKAHDRYEEARRRGDAARAHWIVEGEPFKTVNQVMAVAKARGYDGQTDTIRKRLASGCATWAEIAAPISRTGRPRKQAVDPDVLAAIEAVEARRKAIAAANPEPNPEEE